MKKRMILFIVFTIMLFCCSCTEKEIKKADSINVVTSFYEKDGNRPVYEKLITEYEQKYNVKVNDDSEESTIEWKNKIVNEFETEQEPDVLFFFSGSIAEPIVNDKKVVSINTIREQYSNYAYNINASVLKSMKSMDGNTYAIPVTGYWEGLYINQDLFEKYNIPIPTDWDGFLNAIREFKKNDIVPIAASLSDIPHYLFEIFLYNYTGAANHLLSIPNDATNIPDSWIKGLGQFKEFYDMGAFPKNVNNTTNDETFKMFQEKKAAMLFDGSWTAGKIKDTENVIVIDFPAIPGQPRNSTDMIAGFSMGFYITTKAWKDPLKREAAVEFISYLTSNEAIEKFNVGVLTPSISTQNPESAENPLFQSILDTNYESTAYIGAVQDKFKEKAQTQLFKAIPQIAASKITPEQAIKEFIKNNK